LKKPEITICYSTNFHEVRRNLQGLNSHREVRIHNGEKHCSVVVSEQHVISKRIPVTEREFKLLQQTWQREDTLSSTIRLKKDGELLILRPAQ
jgi:hypothetical protein